MGRLREEQVWGRDRNFDLGPVKFEMPQVELLRRKLEVSVQIVGAKSRIEISI